MKAICYNIFIRKVCVASFENRDSKVVCVALDVETAG